MLNRLGTRTSGAPEPPGAAATAAAGVAVAAFRTLAYHAGRQRERVLARERSGERRHTVEPGSPLCINEFGKKIVDWIEGEKWAKETAPALKDRLEDLRPFRIDQFATEYVDNEIGDALGERVAECAYEFGTDRYAVQATLGVLLRNELLRLTGQQVPHETPADRGTVGE